MRDPYDFQVQGSQEIIEFTDYGGDLDINQVIRILNNATFGAFKFDEEAEVGTQPINTLLDDISLTLRPKRGLTWRMWETALWGIRRAVHDYRMDFEWNFLIITLSPVPATEGIVGYGSLRKQLYNSGIRGNDTSTA